MRNGQLNLGVGLLRTDKLVMTNTCGLFVHTGGTLVVGSVVLATNTDADGDGMSNGYEQGHALDPLDPSDANIDSDGDGLTNLQEFQAGTDPTNSASLFGITGIAAEGDDFRVTWATVGGKTNFVQATSDLASNFADISSAIVIVGGGLTSTNYLDGGAVTNVPARYYRVRLVQ